MSTQITPLIGPRGTSGGLFPSQVQRSTQRDLEYTLGQALVARAREQARAALTTEILEEVGSLSALEAHLIHIAPLGEARYRAVVDAFTVSSAAAISRL